MYELLEMLDTNFKYLTHPDLIMKVETMADLLAIHPRYPLPWPEVVPDPNELKQLISDFKELVSEAAKGNRDKIAERNEKRPIVEMKVTLTGQYLVMKAIKENDSTMLQGTGFDVRAKPKAGGTSATVATYGVPTDFTVKHGSTSGTVIAKLKRMGNGGNYQLQMCLGDPAGEESWTDLGLHTHCTGIEVKDLIPGQRYTFRIRYHGANGPSPWSANVSIIAL